MSVVALPPGIRTELLRRWREDHRRYHGETHLRQGLAALEALGAGPLEVVAFWFHDAVHTSTSPDDEQASADLTRQLLKGVLAPEEVAEVVRLVLITIDHDPGLDDAAGARLSDADLSALASGWDDYLGNTAALRAERPDLDDASWQARRLAFLDVMEGRAVIFRTPLGVASWEAAARRNLARERLLLTTRPAAGTSGA